jgi:polygalacturonase
MMKALAPVVALSLFACAAPKSFSILEYGAIAGDATDGAALANSRALRMALRAANGTGPGSEVLVPAGHSFEVFNTTVADLVGITLRIDGSLLMSRNRTRWTALARSAKPSHGSLGVGDAGRASALLFRDCSDLTVTGKGSIDGRGHAWWNQVLLGLDADHRPDMVNMVNMRNTVIENVSAFNSPRFHWRLHAMDTLVVRGVTIRVDVREQMRSLRLAGHWDEARGLPTFPLNTDGIDPAGRNILVKNCTIENFDDAVAVKPSHGGEAIPCTENVVVEDLRVRYGVGVAIGSITPSPAHECIRNVTVQRVHFERPLKAVHIKFNIGPSEALPVTQGDEAPSAEVTDVVYRNISIDNALWYPIWIGPQQQHQPREAGRGCSFLFPRIGKCAVDPRTSVSGILLENIRVRDAVTLPGVIQCGKSRPCDLKMRNVTSKGGVSLFAHVLCWRHCCPR